MKTRVSHNGILYKIAGEVKSTDKLPHDSKLIGHGKHVNPNGHYVDAKVVALYQTSKGLLIIK